MKTFYEMLRLLSEEGEMDAKGEEGLASQDPVAGTGEDGAVQAPQDAAPEAGEKEEPKNYMFFSNLRVIKNNVEQILAMDPKEIDALLEDGHGWAVDHIATSKDDIEEVYGWLIGRG